MGISIILGLLALFTIIFVFAGLRIVQQSETMIIERLGKYNRMLTSGINIIIPVFDKPREIVWRYIREGHDGKNIIVKKYVTKIDLRETVYDFPKQNVITRDNVVTEINAILYFQIIDPLRAIYEIANLPDAIEKLTQTTLRNVIGEMDLDQTLTSRDTINSKLRAVLDDATHKWGVKINRVELQDINPPHDIRDAMEKQMRAERDKRAKILEAEGQAQAQLEIAEAEAQSIKKITAAISSVNGDPVNYLIAIRYIDALKDMVSGKDNKIVYLPYEATAILSSIASIKDLFENQTDRK
jgi:regulator of protease activity HflC (stomatin/prohibitin superfamily)